MAVYLGVDLHVRQQTVCWCDTAEGAIQERTLNHGEDDVRGFYAQFPAPAVVGVESVGYAEWFHGMLEELGHQVVVGDARLIRLYARRRQKNDRRDAALLLDLLLRGEFPAVHRPCPGSREVLSLLRYRDRLVRMRTRLRNGLQAVALTHGLRLGSSLFTLAGQARLQALPLNAAETCQCEHSLALLRDLGLRIRHLEQQLQARAESDARVARLRTHPGVGLLTALAVVHTLEPVSRFRRARQVAAYCGLDPAEHSSGDAQRWGHISKQGNRMLRFLLVEAAQRAVRDRDGLGRFYQRLLARKNSAVALTAAARKLALRLYCMLRDQIDYAEFRRRGREVGVPALKS